LLDASACVRAPDGGLFLREPFPDPLLVSIAIAVAGRNVYVGTARYTAPAESGGDAGLPYVGAVDRESDNGATSEPLTAPAFNFGALASDGARLYYVQTSGRVVQPGSSEYTVIAPASIDLATGAVHPIATLASPWPSSSNLNSDMIAATPAWPGVFWIGGGQGAEAATTLSTWDPASDTVTTVATGQSLSGPAVDATGVYWADTGGGQGITVYRSPFGGGPQQTLVNVPGGTHGVLLGVSTTDVVFVGDSATAPIFAVSKGGGTARLLMTATLPWLNAFAWVDDIYLYWVEPVGSSTLQRIPVAGGPVVVLPTQGQIQSMAFDACNVYIASQGPGRLFALPK